MPACIAFRTLWHHWLITIKIQIKIKNAKHHKNIISKFKAVHKFIGCASSFKQEAFRAFPNMDSTSRTDAHWQMRPLYFNAFRVSSWRLATYLYASFRLFWKTPTDRLIWLNWHWHHYMFSRHRLSQIKIQTQKTSTHTDTAIQPDSAW